MELAAVDEVPTDGTVRFSDLDMTPERFERQIGEVTQPSWSSNHRVRRCVGSARMHSVNQMLGCRFELQPLAIFKCCSTGWLNVQ